jgi:tetratricopeptide (TPR) repeat protein
LTSGCNYLAGEVSFDFYFTSRAWLCAACGITIQSSGAATAALAKDTDLSTACFLFHLSVLFAAADVSSETQLRLAIIQSQRLAAAGLPGSAVDVLEKALRGKEAIKSVTSASALNELGRLYLNAGRLPESEKALRGARLQFERHYGPNPAQARAALTNLATLYKEQGKLAKAQAVLERLLEGWRADEADDPSVATVWVNLANIHLARGHTSEAERCAHSTIRILKLHSGKHVLELASAHNILALRKADTGDVRGAIDETNQAVALIESSFTTHHPELAPYLLNLATFLMQLSNWSEAESILQRVLSVTEATMPQTHPRRARTLGLLSALYAATGRSEEAKRLSRSAATVANRYRKANYLDLLISVDDLVPSK